jgi:IrrE N-terminal-like domain
VSDIAGDAVLVFPALSLRCIEQLGETVVRHFQPSALDAPAPIDVRDWVDRLLPPFGVHVMPASCDELGERAATTYPAGRDESEILVEEWIFNDLAIDPRPHFARATVMHELAHAILHVPILRTLARAPEHELALARADAASVPAYSDPEWQAWALAGAILMPHRTIAMLEVQTARTLADAYIVSEKFAAVRLKRLLSSSAAAAAPSRD